MQHGHTRSTWVATAPDLAAGFVLYVNIVPDVQVAVIDIHTDRVGATARHARVLYGRTALDPAANDHVRELGEKDRLAGKGIGGRHHRWAGAGVALTRGGNNSFHGR